MTKCQLYNIQNILKIFKSIDGLIFIRCRNMNVILKMEEKVKKSDSHPVMQRFSRTQMFLLY